MGNQPPSGSDMDSPNVSGSQSKRQSGIPDGPQPAPQLGHPSSPAMVRVLKNNPIRSKPSELLEPFNPCFLPACVRSWQGNPAVTTKPLLDDSHAERIGFAEGDGAPADSLGGKAEGSGSREDISMVQVPLPFPETPT